MITKNEKIKNIICFIYIIFGESFIDGKIMDDVCHFSPEYLIEKWERYMLSEKDESGFGIHPNLYEKIQEYFIKWELNENDN